MTGLEWLMRKEMMWLTDHNWIEELGSKLSGFTASYGVHVSKQVVIEPASQEEPTIQASERKSQRARSRRIRRELLAVK